MCAGCSTWQGGQCATQGRDDKVVRAHPYLWRSQAALSPLIPEPTTATVLPSILGLGNALVCWLSESERAIANNDTAICNARRCKPQFKLQTAPTTAHINKLVELRVVTLLGGLVPFLFSPLGFIFMVVLFNGNVETVGQRTCLNSCPTCKFPSPLLGDHSMPCHGP